MASAVTYAAFDAVVAPHPAWVQAWPASLGLHYRIQVDDLTGQATLELRQAGTAALELGVRVPRYQPAGAPELTVTVPPGAGVSLPLTLVGIDQGIYLDDPVVVTRAGGALVPAKPVPPTAPAALVAYTVTPTKEDVRFRASALVYLPRPDPQGRLDIHFRSKGIEPIHAEFAVIGWQPLRSGLNPRLHVASGGVNEVIIADESAGLAHGKLEQARIVVWDVRVGDDRGPFISPGVEVSSHFPEVDGASPVIAGGWAGMTVAFEPQALLWRLIGTTPQGCEIGLRNRGSLPVAGVIGFAPIEMQTRPQRFAVDPGADEKHLILPTPAGLVKPFLVAIDRVALAKKPITPPGAAHPLPAIPQTALPVVARYEDRRFNPQPLLCTVTSGAAGSATVTILNTLPMAVYFDWSLAGYQDGQPSNQRVAVLPLQQITVTVPVTRNDLRLALASVQVWNVRYGEDVGEMQCVAPAP